MDVVVVDKQEVVRKMETGDKLTRTLVGLGPLYEVRRNVDVHQYKSKSDKSIT